MPLGTPKDIMNLLEQKEGAVQYYGSTLTLSETVISPKCVVIIGKLASMNSTQIAAFESFRNSLSGVQILTFDELYQRVIDLIAILSETPSPTQHTPELEDEGDEFPF